MSGCRRAVTKHLKLTNWLRGCSGDVGGCSGSGLSPGGCGVRSESAGSPLSMPGVPRLGRWRGGDLGLPTGWTDFLCRVMPRTGFRDEGAGPRAEPITARVCCRSLSSLTHVLLPFPQKKTFSAFHKLNLLSK